MRSKVSENLHRKMTVESLQHLKTLDGQKMVYTIDQEGELYFHHLIKEWNRVETRNI